MTPDSTLAVTNTCPKDGVHLFWRLTRRPLQVAGFDEGEAMRARNLFTAAVAATLLLIGWLVGSSKIASAQTNPPV